MREMLASLKETSPGLSNNAVFKIVAEKWKTTSAEERAPYEATALKAKAGLQLEREEWNAAHTSSIEGVSKVFSATLRCCF
jgi:hypothetical protein